MALFSSVTFLEDVLVVMEAKNLKIDDLYKNKIKGDFLYKVCFSKVMVFYPVAT